jgi:hypothetical protein
LAPGAGCLCKSDKNGVGAERVWKVLHHAPMNTWTSLNERVSTGVSAKQQTPRHFSPSELGHVRETQFGDLGSANPSSDRD